MASVACEALAEAEPQVLGVTYWFDAAPDGDPYPATVRFVGHRRGLEARPGPRDTFVVTESVERVVPGSGRVSVTARIAEISAGQWNVNAMLIAPHHSTTKGRPSGRQLTRRTASASGATGFGPVIGVRAPGARLGAWPALVGVGVAVAFIVQSRLAASAHLRVGQTLWVSLVASVVGLLGARIYYLAEQRPRVRFQARALLTAGMCIQGFVLGTLVAVSIGALVAGLSVGRFLDVTAPGLLFGMSIGRWGCFLGGCCAGRPTASRWGLWSSDRRVGTRRVPTQLLESVVAFAVGLVAWLAVRRGTAVPAGAVFVGAIAAYTLGRQLLLPLRDLPRKTRYGRGLVAALAAAVVLAEIAVTVVG